jgi:uncharacterized OB-fold protein
MTAIQCSSCGRRYATPRYRCGQCWSTAFGPVAISEQAIVEATTVVHVSRGSESPRRLIVAQLSDLAVLAVTSSAVKIGDAVLVEDAPTGGFRASVVGP